MDTTQSNLRFSSLKHFKSSFALTPPFLRPLVLRQPEYSTKYVFVRKSRKHAFFLFNKYSVASNSTLLEGVVELRSSHETFRLIFQQPDGHVFLGRKLM